MNALRRQTALRMRKKAIAEEQRKVEEQRRIEKKLNEISDARRSHDQRTPASFVSIHSTRSKTTTLRAILPGLGQHPRWWIHWTFRPRFYPGLTGLGNGRYAIDDTSFTEPVTKQLQARSTPPSKQKQPKSSSSPQTPQWSSALADSSPVDVDQPQGIAQEPAPSDNQVYVPQHTAVPTWRKDDDEWSDDSLAAMLMNLHYYLIRLRRKVLGPLP